MNKKIWETPIKIRDVKIKNRIIFPPIGTSWANIDGTASLDVIKWYKELAEGGCGMIVVEGSAISPEGKSGKKTLCIYNKEHLPNLKILAKTIKENDCFASIQILHAGGQANPEFTGFGAISPSYMNSKITGTGHSSREMNLFEIKEVEKKFFNSAKLAYDAGFQAVELHLAHGYLLHEFLSEHTNKRKDRYGGSLENRLRLVLSIIENIKKEIPELIMGARISGEDYIEDGINEEANKKILPILEKRGLEYLSVTAGTYETSKFKHQSMQKGEFFNYSHKIKDMVKIPVIGVGKILDIDSTEKHLNNKDCDMVAIGRGLIADPKMVYKSKNNLDFNRCIECGECQYLRLGKPELSCPISGV